jgi:hypothetical protein
LVGHMSVNGRFDVIESDRPECVTAEFSPSVVDYFAVYHCQPEAVFAVPALVDQAQGRRQRGEAGAEDSVLRAR